MVEALEDRRLFAAGVDPAAFSNFMEYRDNWSGYVNGIYVRKFFWDLAVDGSDANDVIKLRTDPAAPGNLLLELNGTTVSIDPTSAGITGFIHLSGGPGDDLIVNEMADGPFSAVQVAGEEGNDTVINNGWRGWTSGGDGHDAFGGRPPPYVAWLDFGPDDVIYTPPPPPLPPPPPPVPPPPPPVDPLGPDDDPAAHDGPRGVPGIRPHPNRANAGPAGDTNGQNHPAQDAAVPGAAFLMGNTPPGHLGGGTGSRTSFSLPDDGDKADAGRAELGSAAASALLDGLAG